MPSKLSAESFYFSAFFTVIIQYLVLSYKLNNGNFLDVGVFPFFNLIFLVFSSIVAYLIHSLSKALLNITERSRKNAEERYRILIENLQEGVFFIVDGKIEFVNRSLADMLGYTPDEMVGMNYLDMVDPAYREEVNFSADGREKHTMNGGTMRSRLS